MDNIHIHGQLLCVGIQTFTMNGELMDERHMFKHESWSTSRGKESYTATGLLPNCHYTCHMVSVAGKRQTDTDLAPQATFHTSPGSRLTTAHLHVYNTTFPSLNPHRPGISTVIQNFVSYRAISSSKTKTVCESGWQTHFQFFT